MKSSLAKHIKEPDNDYPDEEDDHMDYGSNSIDLDDYDTWKDVKSSKKSGASVTCSNNSECPMGTTCNSGMCSD